ncbi:MAG: hypothetical protein IK130_08550, partial [Oscillospiraceae bacterium]|nr:hypothetical protein [Oscillospiraceae bacterium]
MNKMVRKTLAAVMALTVITGGLPAVADSADLLKTAITAEAADAGEQLVTPTVGVTYKWGTDGYGAN